MRDKLKGKRIMVWTFMGNSRMYQALRDYGDRIDTIGLFSFKVDATGTITESGVAISNMLTYIEKWPHIRWLLTVANDGANSIFKAIRDNTDGAQDTFCSELVRIMEKYPWCSGVDIDLEKGDGYSTHEASTAMFKHIYETVKAYDPTKEMNICLPGMTSVNGSVGGENWCVYGDLDKYCDTASIMSYGMAWAGSAPGPVSPRSWLEGIYDYATKVMNPDKVFLGMPAYGWNWQIYDTPENLGKYYRGTSHTYYAAKYWMQGLYNFTDDAPPQPFIPIVSYWDDYDMGPWALPHVYDYMEGRDAVYKEYPQMAEVYNRRRYLTAYAKQQKTEFGDIIIDHNAEPDSYGGVVSVSETLVTLGDEGTATYKFTIDEAGTYDVAIRLCYPFWDKNSIYASLDGSTVYFSEDRLWWPYWRTTFWATLAKGVSLSAGEHTLTISVGVNGVQFYGFRVCTDFSEEPTAGQAEYTLAPRKFKEVNGDMVGPSTGFKLTLEMLRRKPDSALVWYEDFRDEEKIPESYWTVLSGEWDVWQEDLPYGDTSRPYSQLEGYGQLAWNYNGFSDIHLRAQIIFPEDGGGKAGVFLGSLFCCFNYDSQCIELYEGSTLKGSYAIDFSKTAKADLRTNPNVYTIEMRKRGKIEFIITKSISRFARNTTDCLEMVRKLTDLGVSIFFEKENINTGSMESELMLSILSSLAESESVSISENEKWSIRKRFENGTFIIAYPPYGYENDNGSMVIVPEQAEVVREIFAACLAGKGTHAIAKELNARGLKTKKNGKWGAGAVNAILTNEKYTGDVIFQKTYSDSSFNRHINYGERDRFLCQNHHEPIISHEDFDRVRAVLDQRAMEKGNGTDTYRYQNRYCFSGKIKCGECGATFKRRQHYKPSGDYVAWTCGTHL